MPLDEIIPPNVTAASSSDSMPTLAQLEPLIQRIVAEELAKFRKEVAAHVLRVIANQSRLQGIRRT